MSRRNLTVDINEFDMKKREPKQGKAESILDNLMKVPRLSQAHSSDSGRSAMSGRTGRESRASKASKRARSTKKRSKRAKKQVDQVDLVNPMMIDRASPELNRGLSLRPATQVIPFAKNKLKIEKCESLDFDS